MTTDVRAVFLGAGAVVPEVVTSVADRWTEPSALDGWTVGGLVGHLSRAVTTVGTYLAGDPPGTAGRLDAVGYFSAVPLADPAMRGEVLRRGVETGSVGPERLAGLVAAELAALERALPGVEADRDVSVLGGRVMRLDDYLVTRVVEMVVHVDDVRASVATVPELPEAAVDLALATMVDLATRVHGRSAMIAALARSERAVPIEVF